MVFFDPFAPQQRARPRFSAKEKELHYKHQGGKCNGCGKKFPIQNMELDHIRPFSKGGNERGNNLQVLCGYCNKSKGNGTMAQLKKKLQAEGIIKSGTKATAKSPSKTAAKSKTTKKAPAKKRSPRKTRDPFADLFGF